MSSWLNPDESNKRSGSFEPLPAVSTTISTPFWRRKLATASARSRDSFKLNSAEPRTSVWPVKLILLGRCSLRTVINSRAASCPTGVKSILPYSKVIGTGSARGVMPRTERE